MFRGFDAVGDKGWVYGNLTHNQKVTKTGLEPRTMVGGYEVVPESVGISTGITDVDGKEIFVGDIVRVYKEDGTADFSSEVFWKDGACKIFYFERLNIALGDYIAEGNLNVKVIGNTMGK